MRSRKSTSRESESPRPESPFLAAEEKEKYPVSNVPFYVGVLFLCFLLAIFGLVLAIYQQLPTPLKISDEKEYPDRFIAERAQEDLRYLTDLGPRVVGSHENEVLAVEFLKKQITEIISNADESQQIELDVQVVSGSYFLNYKPTNQINVYANVQNVVVKLYGQIENESLLLNAHFDSVPTSPGGSDDGINCAAMLEILRKLSKRAYRPNYSVIFLFNGAEESVLQASHGFITQHKWSKECKVLINLEAAGAGGKITMFQNGPDRPWLTEAYGEVPHPRGMVTSEELFQLNIIPSDTDFRIFRDFGNLVGMDMAFIKDGYRYHTKYDGFDNIPLGSYQQIGDNVLSLIQNIANNSELANKHPKTGKMVFFDYIDLIFIYYSSQTATILNLTVCLASAIIFLISWKKLNLGFSAFTIFYFAHSFAFILFGFIMAFLFVIFLGFIVDFFGHGMSWYGNPWIIIGIFVLPTIIVSTPILLFIQTMHLSPNTNNFMQVQIMRMIWSGLLFIATVLGVRSAYLVLNIVIFDALICAIILICRLEHTVWLWKVMYIVTSILPSSYVMSGAIEFYTFFIPLTGRIGSFRNPDIIIGFATVAISLALLTPYYFLVSCLTKPINFYKILLAIFVVFLAIVFTPLGFPYSGDPTSPTPQRFWIFHTERIFHGEDGGIIKKDSGYFLLNMDRNSPQSVSQYVEELNLAISVEDDCKNFLLCGLPLAHPKMTQIVEYSTWIPASQPVFTDKATLIVNSKNVISSNLIRYNITIQGPDRIMFYISPKKHLQLSRTNLLDKMIDEPNYWNDRPYYFSVYTCGKEIVPLHIILDIETPNNYKGPAMDIAVSGQYVHSKEVKIAADFQKFLSKFPDWADLTYWPASYESWII